MKTTIEKRIANLESKFRSAEIILQMPDGSRQAIRLAPGEDVLSLWDRVIGNPDGAEADAIRRAVSYTDSSGSRMVEVCQALLNGPAETEVENEKERIYV